MGATEPDTDDSGEQIAPKLKGKSEYGPSAERRAKLAQASVPMHVLAAAGVETREAFDPENARAYPTSVTLDGTTVHLHQDVQEDSEDDAFGNFGAAEDDVETVTWTVVDLTDESVTLTVVGDWGKRRDVPFDEFPDDYEPLTLADGQPKWGY